MGSSAKRKKEKAADFQKVKLKVGKTKPKATSATNTSFAARSIVLGQQSLSTSAPSANAQFLHSLSLLTSKSDTQRKEALASLTNTLSALPSDAPLPAPAVTVILKTRPLLIDATKTVRAGALALLRTIPPKDIEPHASDLLIYVHIGLTHMSADIRTSSLDALDFLLSTAGQAVVSIAGGWTGSLRRLTGLLNWDPVPLAADARLKGWTAATRSGKLDDAKARARLISLLGLLVETGLKTEEKADSVRGGSWPIWDAEAHRMPTKPDPYGHLGLFAEGVGQEDDASVDTAVLGDAEGRMEALKKVFEEGIRKGLTEVKKEGGEVGRAAVRVERAMVSLKQVP